MKKDVKIFNFKDNQIRMEMINGEPYFCGLDVCNALSIKNNRNVITRLQDGVHTVDVIDKMGRKQAVSYVNEPNLYKIALQSRKPEAEPFVNWVCKVVLPSIREYGQYVNPVQPVEVQSYTRSLPSGKKEIVLSEKAKAEIGGIFKACMPKILKDEFRERRISAEGIDKILEYERIKTEESRKYGYMLSEDEKLLIEHFRKKEEEIPLKYLFPLAMWNCAVPKKKK